MKQIRKTLITIVAITLLFLVACVEKADESKLNSENEQNIEQQENSDQSNSNEDVEENDEDLVDEGELEDIDDSQGDSEVNELESNNQKEYFLQMLNAIEKELEALTDDGTTVGMEKTAQDTYQMWDDALNEIYVVIIDQLNTEDVEILRAEQRGWIKYRDEVAEQEAAGEGSLQSITYVLIQAKITKERCYELVEEYL